MNTTYRYNLTHCYLEVARGAIMQIHAQAPESVVEEDVIISDDMTQAVLALVSMTIIYSFLALESFLTYQLYRLWERRSDGTAVSARFLEELGDQPNFEVMKGNSKVREVPNRLRCICRILGYSEPHESIPDTWRRLNQLAQTSRHFLVHPLPDSELFHENMRRIMMETETGAYVQIVEEVLAFLWRSAGSEVPEWGTRNTLLEFRGVNLLPVQAGRAGGT